MKDLMLIGLVALAAVVLVLPVYRYVRVGWHAKRADIMDCLSPEARLAYCKMFRRSEADPSKEEASKVLEELYDRWYGRRLFFGPVIVVAIVAVVSIDLAIGSVLRSIGYLAPDKESIGVPFVGVAAIAGAYMWVANDFISRARRLDFAPSDLLWGALRLTIAIPLGYSVAALAADAIGPFVAFAIGAFPMGAITTILNRATYKALGQQEISETQNDNVLKLQGVNSQIVDRLANEDLTTITQVAFCDPIRLAMRSNLSFNFITDCMNQALAWEYLGEDLNKIRRFGLRGAVEIDAFLKSLDVQGTAGDLARSALTDIAKALEQSEATTRMAFASIANDSFSQFLTRVWD